MTDVSSRISVSGMDAYQRQLDVISNNIANVSTVGFRGAQAGLTDLGYSGGISAPVGPNGAEVRLEGVGEGTAVADLHHDFTPGTIQSTGSPLDAAIDGDAFFTVSQADGQLRYTRDGSFSLDGSGKLVTADGLAVQGVKGALTVPATAQNVQLEADGSLHYLDSTGADQSAGTLALARFVNPRGLLADGGNLWAATPTAGAPQAVSAGSAAADVHLVNQALEGSNVDLTNEFTRMIQAQRGYQVNMRMVQTWDQLEQMANELRR